MILIKGDLFFDPEKRRLCKGDKELPLTENMSRCLSVLLKNKGEIVTKETLLKEVWEKNGVIVTETSIRQTLSQIRKSFAKLNISEELIYTLPRQGYKISNDGENISDNPHSIPTDTAESIPSVVTDGKKDKVTSKNFFHFRMIMVTIVGFLLFFVMSMFLYFRYYIVTDMRYVRISDNQTREIWISDRLYTDSAYISGVMHTLDSYIDKNIVKPPKSYQVYINRTIRPDVYSFFICDRAGEPPDCQAIYINSGHIE